MTWDKYGAYLLGPQGTGFEEDLVYAPRILKNLDGTPYVDGNGKYHLYYAGGKDQSAGSQDQMGLAYISSDFTTITRYVGNPVFPVVPGTYYSGDIVFITVIKDGATWHAWFEANRDNPPSSDYVTIGYASSTDGINWAPNAGPILIQGTGDDSLDLYCPCVIKDGATWKMWFQGHNASSQYCLMYATASNPQGPWTKYSTSYIWTNAAGYIAPSEVWKEGSTFFMTYYSDGLDIRVATSPDGLTWTDRGSAMHISASGWDSYWVYWATDMRVGGTWYHYYAGLEYNNGVRIGLATSTLRTPWSSESGDGIATTTGTAAVGATGNAVPVGENIAASTGEEASSGLGSAGASVDAAAIASGTEAVSGAGSAMATSDVNEDDSLGLPLRDADGYALKLFDADGNRLGIWELLVPEPTIPPPPEPEAETQSVTGGGIPYWEWAQYRYDQQRREAERLRQEQEAARRRQEELEAEAARIAAEERREREALALLNAELDLALAKSDVAATQAELDRLRGEISERKRQEELDRQREQEELAAALELLQAQINAEYRAEMERRRQAEEQEFMQVLAMLLMEI